MVDQENEVLLARLYLGAILPRLEDIAAFDRVTREAIKDWRFTLQFRLAGGGPATTIVFEEGAARAYRGKLNRPGVTLTFKNARFLNEVFQGKTQKSPRPNLRGLFQLKELMQIGKVLQRLDYYLKPGPELLAEPETYTFCVRLALYVLAFGIREIGEHDPEMRPVTAHLPDGVLEIRVVEGPAAHVAVKQGTFTPGRGPAEKPNAVLEIADLDTAWGMIQGSLDLFAAIGSERIKLRGLIPLVDGINPLLDRLSFYLAG